MKQNMKTGKFDSTLVEQTMILENIIKKNTKINYLLKIHCFQSDKTPVLWSCVTENSGRKQLMDIFMKYWVDY